jgi:hypothetical protein
MTQVITQESYAALDNSSRVLLDLQILMEIHCTRTAPGLVILNGMSQEVAGALTKFGFNLDLLIKAANPALRTSEYFEEIMNDFSQNNHKMAIDSDIAAMSTKHHFGLPSYNDTLWQQAIIETGFVYTRSPISGKSLRSNKSFVLSKGGYTILAYYFEDDIPFFLFSGSAYGFEYGFFVPSMNLCIQYYNCVPELTIQDAVLLLCEKFALHSQVVKDYLNSKQPHRTVLLACHGSNLAHHVWQELSGIDFLSKMDLLDKIDYFLVGSFDYFNLRSIYDEISVDRIIRISSSSDQLFLIPLLLNSIVCMNLQSVLTDSMASKVIDAARSQASDVFLERISEVIVKYPIIWFGLRTSFRKWEGQVNGIVNIINSLSELYPNLLIVLDGWSNLPGYEKQPKHVTVLGSKSEGDFVGDERKMAFDIKRRVNSKVEVLDLIGCLTLDKVIVANSIDAFVVGFGSGDVFISRIANKPGVFHTNEYFYKYAHMEARHRENYNSKNLIIAGSLTKKQEDQNLVHHSDYECDWKQILNHLILILNN